MSVGSDPQCLISLGFFLHSSFVDKQNINISDVEHIVEAGPEIVIVDAIRHPHRLHPLHRHRKGLLANILKILRISL